MEPEIEDSTNTENISVVVRFLKDLSDSVVLASVCQGTAIEPEYMVHKRILFGILDNYMDELNARFGDMELIFLYYIAINDLQKIWNKGSIVVSLRLVATK